LSDYANLKPFHMIFLAGGMVEEDVLYDTDGSDSAGNVPLVQAALKKYVEKGGILWATDWTYDAVEQIWPDEATFLGDDTVPNSAQLAEPGGVDAHVEDSDFKKAMGSASVTVKYSNDTWPVIVSADAATVLETADVPYRIGMNTFTQSDSPLGITFDDGKGKVIYTTWMVEDNVDDSSGGISYLLSL
jgi:hypothetical protein